MRLSTLWRAYQKAIYPDRHSAWKPQRWMDRKERQRAAFENALGKRIAALERDLERTREDCKDAEAQAAHWRALCLRLRDGWEQENYTIVMEALKEVPDE